MNEIEQLLNRVEKELEIEKAVLLQIEESIRRVQEDKFPHIPLMPLYKRPPIPPNYC